MWRRRLVDATAIAAVATVTILVIGASTVRAPNERLFGMPIVGRHYDPFAVMTQMMAPATASLYLQPITDLPAALAARVIGPVAAFNAIVLISFPLSAVTAFLLARHLGLSRVAAAVAAMAYAFSPFHMAHAAYHAHVAQTQWLPLYLLALLRCLERATPRAAALLALATLTVALSNYYGGVIAAVITPFAVAGRYWPHRHAQTTRALAITTATLGLSAIGTVAYAAYTSQRLAETAAELAYRRTDLLRYGARWWSYLVPPVEHPLLGDTALRVWHAAGVREGLLEQQINVGFGIALLAVIGAAGWWLRDRSRSAGYVPMLAIVAVAGFAFSLSPERDPGLTFRPAAWLYEIAPMFRSHARFGVAVQLAAVLLAGIGVDRLRRAASKLATGACIALIVLAVGEYAVRPSAMSRDVLPTAAHRWVLANARHARVLDCAPLTMESESIGWLTRGHVTLAGAAIESCGGEGLPAQLAANGFTHLIERPPFDGARAPRAGLALAARFDDGRLYEVTARPPAVYTAGATGFDRRERDANWSWRSMGDQAMLIVVNTSGVTLQAMLQVELAAFQQAREMEIHLDGRCISTLRVLPWQQGYPIGPMQLPPGSHELVFHSVAATTGPAFAVGAALWTVAQ